MLQQAARARHTAGARGRLGVRCCGRADRGKAPPRPDPAARLGRVQPGPRELVRPGPPPPQPAGGGRVHRAPGARDPVRVRPVPARRPDRQAACDRRWSGLGPRARLPVARPRRSRCRRRSRRRGTSAPRSRGRRAPRSSSASRSPRRARRSGLVQIPASGTATVPKAAKWLCAPRVRQLTATTLPPAAPADAAVSVTTPSCSRRLTAQIQRTGRPGHSIAVRLGDRWGVGGLALTICVTAPGATQACSPWQINAGRRGRLVRLAVRGREAGA